MDLVVSARPLAAPGPRNSVKTQQNRPRTAPAPTESDHSDLKLAMRLVAENQDLVRVRFRPKPRSQRFFYPCPQFVESSSEPVRNGEICPLARCPEVGDLRRVRKMEKMVNSRNQL